MPPLFLATCDFLGIVGVDMHTPSRHFCRTEWVFATGALWGPSTHEQSLACTTYTKEESSVAVAKVIYYLDPFG